MSEEVRDFTAAPTLSFGAPEPEAPAVQEEKKQEIERICNEKLEQYYQRMKMN